MITTILLKHNSRNMMNDSFILEGIEIFENMWTVHYIAVWDAVLRG
jgi:hypothetical protein